MPNDTHPDESQLQPLRRLRRRQRDSRPELKSATDNSINGQIDVGHSLRRLRANCGLSIRALAGLSGLNANTLSLIENGKTSPSVSTLHQLALALQVPITAFFEIESQQKHIVFQKDNQRPRAPFFHGTIEDLGVGMNFRGGQPLLVTLEPGADSGSAPIVHTGHEFVFCIKGRLTYTIESRDYVLEAGDSLLFEAHLPHRWGNTGENISHSLLILCPSDENDRPTEQHFLSK